MVPSWQRVLLPTSAEEQCTPLVSGSLYDWLHVDCTALLRTFDGKPEPEGGCTGTRSEIDTLVTASYDKMELGQEHGQLQDLSSPVLNKLQQGFKDLRTCLAENCTRTFHGFGSLPGELFRAGLCQSQRTAAPVVAHNKLYDASSVLTTQSASQLFSNIDVMLQVQTSQPCMLAGTLWSPDWC